MNDASNPPDDDPMGPVVESFLARFRRGERPALSELIARHPELAGEIHEVIPALVKLELLGGSTGEPGDFSGHRPASSKLGDAGPSPERLGDYVIVRRIGSGGMGVVYEAEHESLKSRVALKVVHPRFRSDPKYVRRFHAEARVAARLHHTNIVSVFDYGDHDGVCYYAMPFIQGQPLDSVLADVRRLRDEGTHAEIVVGPDAILTIPAASALPRPSAATQGLLTGHFAAAALRGVVAETAELVGALESNCSRPTESVADGGGPDEAISGDPSLLGSSSLRDLRELRYFREIARLGAQVADAMEYAHRRGVLHRDIKPSNLLLDALGNVWVTDFGLAKLEEGDELSQSRELVGTLRYMAPERFRGASDRRGDIYSLGATLYELLALRPPFEESDAIRLIDLIKSDAPVPPRQVDRKIPRDLETIVLKALAKDPRDRFGSAGELADELRRFVDGRPIRSRPVSVVEQLWRWCKRDPWLAGANIAAAVLIIVLALGASIAAVVYRNHAKALTVERGRAETSALDARWRAVDAYTAQAQGGRFSGRPGRRFDSLEAVSQATKLLDGLPPGPETASRRETLRDLAIACLALPDVKPTGRVITVPSGVIKSAFDPTMTRYALRFRDGAISVRRVADDHEIARFRARGDRDISFFCFGRDGRYLATTHDPENSLTVWDVDNGRVAIDHTSPVVWGAARFSPDGRGFALATNNRDVLIYDLATGRPNRRFRLPGVGRLTYRPNGAELAVMDAESTPATCRILDVETGRLKRTIPLGTSTDFLAWSPDGTTLALGGNSKIELYAAATGARRATLEGLDNGGIQLTYHPAGSLLASHDWSGQLRLWDSALGRPLLKLTSVGGPEISEDGRIVVSRDDRMTIHQVDPAAEYRTFTRASPEANTYFHPSVRYDGRLLAVPTILGVSLWDLAHGTELAFLHRGTSWHALFDRSGDLIISGTAGVERWPIHLDAERGQLRLGPPRPISLPKGGCGIAIDRSGRIVAKADLSYAYVANPERTVRVGPLDDCRGLSVSPDGQWLATGTHVTSRGAQVWRIADLTKVAELSMDSGTSVEFSPDGKWLMTSSYPCRLWEVGTWREVRQIGDTAGCFSPDGRLLVVQGANKLIRLVETNTGRTLARLESPDLCGIDPAFTPDGSRLVVTTKDGPAVHVWDLRAIRRRLAGMGLDWDAPPYSDDDPAPLSAPPIRRTRIAEFEYTMSRVEELAYEGRWQEAAAVHSEAFTHGALNRPHCWFERAILCLAVGDSAGYRLSCQHMVDAYHRNNERSWLEFAAHACALATDRPVDSLEALALAETRAGLVPHTWSEHVRELALYRAGRYAEVESRLLARVDRDPSWRWPILDWLVLAMAQQRLGRQSDAHRWLERAENWIAENLRDRPGGLDRAVPQGWHWRDSILMHMLLREARALIDPRLPDLPEDAFAPTSETNATS